MSSFLANLAFPKSWRPGFCKDSSSQRQLSIKTTFCSAAQGRGSSRVCPKALPFLGRTISIKNPNGNHNGVKRCHLDCGCFLPGVMRGVFAG